MKKMSSPTTPSSKKSRSTGAAGAGVHTAVKALKHAVGKGVRDDGPEHLDALLAKSQNSLQKLVAWGKKNPVKSAAAAAALIGVTAFGVAYMKRRASKSAK